jgi:hypothetical protein
VRSARCRQSIVHLGGSALAVFELAAIAGLLLASAYVWSPGLRGFLVWLAPAGLVFPVLFFLNPSTKLILAPPSVELGTGHGAGDVPIVMVVFDEFPIFALVGADGTIDATLFPSFARLAREGTWFRNATSTATVTPSAVGTILTGRLLGGENALANPTTRTNNLFSLLGAAYDLDVTESYVPFCPPGLCGEARSASRRTRQRHMLADAGIVLLHVWAPAGLARRLPDLAYPALLLGAADAAAAEPAGLRADGHWTRAPVERAATLERFIGSITPRARPALHYLHVLVPHVPYVYEPSGGICAGWARTARAEWWYGNGEAHVMQQRLLLQVGWVDRIVGRLIDRLERMGLYEQALLVLVADHGISFRPEEQRRALTEGNACDVLGVPLFIKRPHERAGGVSDRNVELIDVLPTIADVVGIEIPWRVDGGSAFAPAGERARKTVVGPSWPTEKRLGWTAGRLQFPSRFGIQCLMTDRPNPPVAWGTGPRRPFRVGPHGDLVGHVIRGDEIAGPPDAEVVWAAAEASASFAAGPGEVPCLVEGELIAADGSEGIDLAIAINGTIEAVGKTQRRAKASPIASAPFSIPVPAHAFHEGGNDVRVFVPRRNGGSIQLLSTRTNQARR